MAVWLISAPNLHSVSPISVYPCIPLSPSPSGHLSLCPHIPHVPSSLFPVSPVPCVPIPCPIPMSIHPPFLVSPKSPRPCFHYTLCPVSPYLRLPCPSISPYPAISLSLCLLVFMSLYPVRPVSPYPCVTLSLVSICPCAPLPYFPTALLSRIFVSLLSATQVSPVPLWSPRPCDPCPHRVPAVVALSPQGSAGDTDPPSPLQYRGGASSTGGATEPASRSGCGIAALWPLGNEPGRGEGSPRTRNGDSTPGEAPQPETAPEGQNVNEIKFRVMKHRGHSRKGRYGGRWCVLTPPRRWDDPLPSSVPSDGRARAVSGDRGWGRDRG